MSREVVLTSGNAGKLREFAEMFSTLDLRLRAQSEFGVGDVEETGTTFVENAIIKARHAARVSGLPALADDSGLVVDALGGAPGVYSARYAGAGASDAANVARLLDALSDVDEPARTCRFVCVLAYFRHGDDPLPVIATGLWEGRVLTAPRGDNGFGYDPVFHALDGGCAAAELPSARKNTLSHRGQALRALHDLLVAARLA